MTMESWLDKSYTSIFRELAEFLPVETEGNSAPIASGDRKRDRKEANRQSAKRSREKSRDEMSRLRIDLQILKDELALSETR